MAKENPYEVINALHAAAYGDSSTMSPEAWQNQRQKGIGGSEVAAIMGVSPFSSNVQLYLNKTGVIKTDLSDKWFTLQYGHCLEPLAAEYFQRKTQCVIIDETGMFEHPEYTFMKANLDRLAVLSTGEIVILECKTGNPFSKNSWSFVPPDYYQWQGRHYMFVINGILEKLGFETRILRVCYCLIYGNTEEDVIIRQAVLNDTTESDMLIAECTFWYGNVTEGIMPICNGSEVKLFEMTLENRAAIAKASGIEEIASMVNITDPLALLHLQSINVLKAKEKELAATVKDVKEQRASFELALLKLMEGSDHAMLPNGATLDISQRASRTVDYELLRAFFPDVYDMCVKESLGAPKLAIKQERPRGKRKTA